MLLFIPYFKSSVKIQRHPSKSGITSPPPIPEEPIEVTPATRAIRTQVIVPSMSNTIQSHTQVRKYYLQYDLVNRNIFSVREAKKTPTLN